MPIAHATRRHAAHVPQTACLEIKVRAFDLKTMGDEAVGSPARFSGHGAAFFNVDSAGDIIAPGAFAEDLADFLREGHIGGLNHNWDDPIARPVVAYEDEKGLYVETGDIVDTAHGSDVAKLLRGGIITKLSIGFRVLREQRIASMTAIRDFWKSHQYTPSDEDVERAAHAVEVGHVEYDEDGDRVSVKGVRMLRRIKLYEISPVTVPANMLADVTAVKASKVVDPESGVAFGSHARQVVSAAGDFCRRATSRVEARFKVGRELSTANIASLESVADSMEAGCRTLRVLVERAKPAPAPKSDDGPATEKGSSPPEPASVAPALDHATPAVPIPAPVAPADPPAPPPAPGPDDADILARYLATRRAATLALAGSLIPCPTH